MTTEYPAMKQLPLIPRPLKHFDGSTLIIDEWKCPCHHTAGNFITCDLSENVLICKISGLYYSRRQMRNIQGTGWVGEGSNRAVKYDPPPGRVEY